MQPNGMYENHECGILIWNKVIEIDFTVLTYLLHGTNRVHLEKLTGSQLFKKFPAFRGT